MDVFEQLKSVLSDRYAIDREIGAGGMATVYLARDLRHNRRVALKVLRPELGALLGTERFLSEIQVTANLQHPHLLPLFDSGEVAGVLYYVMPYVEGESLRSRLAREQQLPVDDALRIAVAVASALDYAHRQGVVHRDLKPENILLHDGQPMVADFGIALAISKAGGARATQTGVSLGTPQYMSPEQAIADRVIDARSDIYSLAAITYEMLAGEPPHIGHTVQAIVTKVLTEPPQPVRHLRQSVPDHVDTALMKALAKLPADRFSSASEFARALTGENAVPQRRTVEAAVATVPNRRAMVGLVLLAVVGAIVVIAMWLPTTRERVPPAALIQFELPISDSVRVERGLALSPDGAWLAFRGVGPQGAGIYLRSMSGSEMRFLRGTDGATAPLFSPDGAWLLFSADDKLKKIPVAGGGPIVVVDTPGAAPTWSDRDQIVYRLNSDLWRVSANGGSPTRLVQRDSARGLLHHGWPHALPGGNYALITRWKRSSDIEDAELAVMRMSDGEVTELGISGANARYLPGGFIVFARADGTVYAARFSRQRMRLLSSPLPVLHGFSVLGRGGVDLAVSANGIAVFQPPYSVLTRPVRVTRQGVAQPISVNPGTIQDPRISPDGRRLALTIHHPGFERWDIWIHDFATGVLTRLTNDGASARPEWTPDGSRVAFLTTNGGDIMWKPTDAGATPSLLAGGTRPYGDVAFGPLNGLIAFRTGSQFMNHDILIAPQDSPQALRPLLDSPVVETIPTISPDGTLLAYVREEAGRRDVHVQSFSTGVRIPISLAGGDEPVWAPGGGELFYRTSTHLMSAKLATTPRLDLIGTDTVFADPFMRNQIRGNYDVFPNGSEFVFIQAVTTRPRNLIGIANWTTELQRMLDAAR